jgi:BirA family biotin operon repressor/biotin-[acetyl-CoA-carboxylase] ligase
MKTMSKQKVLTLLRQAQGGYLSGESMSAQLGISRAAVWKAIESLRQEGYEINSVTRKGYQLVGAPNRLTEGEILPYLHSQQAKERLICLEQIDSTNNYAKKLAIEGGLDSTAIVANEQTGGRGRLGRSFQSPRDAGIYLTLLYRPQIPPMQAVNLTAYVAVAICQGIEAACGVRPGIKWTNDIVLGGKKLAGILTEMGVEGETGSLQYLITGIGLNVCQKKEDFPEELWDIATSLEMELGKPVSRGRLAAELINALERMYSDWLQGTGTYWDWYRDNCLTLGREVRLVRPGRQEERAVAEDIDRDFGLIVRYPDGRRETITSGEVSVRGLCGYL